jgi:hypothetical protein
VAGETAQYLMSDRRDNTEFWNNKIITLDLGNRKIEIQASVIVRIAESEVVIGLSKSELKKLQAAKVSVASARWNGNSVRFLDENDDYVVEYMRAGIEGAK